MGRVERLWRKDEELVDSVSDPLGSQAVFPSELPSSGSGQKLAGLRKEAGFRVDPSSLRGMQGPAGSLRGLT